MVSLTRSLLGQTIKSFKEYILNKNPYLFRTQCGQLGETKKERKRTGEQHFVKLVSLFF